LVVAVTTEPATPLDRNRAALDAIQVRRDRLYEAVLELERALTAPAGDDAPRWAIALGTPVHNLLAVLEAHVGETEGPGALFEQLQHDAPRLLHAVDKLRQEHEPLLARTEALSARLDQARDSADVDAIRTDALELIQALLVHRQRGAELVYDAYNVDVSAGD
jgi:hypothetical protein